MKKNSFTRREFMTTTGAVVSGSLLLNPVSAFASKINSNSKIFTEKKVTNYSKLFFKGNHEQNI